MEKQGYSGLTRPHSKLLGWGLGRKGLRRGKSAEIPLLAAAGFPASGTSSFSAGDLLTPRARMREKTALWRLSNCRKFQRVCQFGEDVVRPGQRAAGGSNGRKSNCE